VSHYFLESISRVKSLSCSLSLYGKSLSLSLQVYSLSLSLSLNTWFLSLRVQSLLTSLSLPPTLLLLPLHRRRLIPVLFLTPIGRLGERYSSSNGSGQSPPNTFWCNSEPKICRSLGVLPCNLYLWLTYESMTSLITVYIQRMMITEHTGKRT